jgi:hypothetical protein
MDGLFPTGSRGPTVRPPPTDEERRKQLGIPTAPAQGASAARAQGTSASAQGASASAYGASAARAQGASASAYGASAARAQGAAAALGPRVSLIDMENRIDLIIFYTLDQLIVPYIPNEIIDTKNRKVIQTEIDRLKNFFPNMMGDRPFPNYGRVGNSPSDASRNSTLFTLFNKIFNQIINETGITGNDINRNKLKQIKRLISKTINPPVLDNKFNKEIVEKYFTIFIQSVIQLFEHRYFHAKLENSHNYLKNFSINLALSILNEMAYVSSDDGQYLKWLAVGSYKEGPPKTIISVYKDFVQWTCSMIIQQFGTINKPNLVSINLPKIGDIVDTSNSNVINSIFYDVKTSLTNTYPRHDKLIMERKDEVIVSPGQKNPIFFNRRKINIDHPIGLTPNNKLTEDKDNFVILSERPDNPYEINIDEWPEHNRTDYNSYAEEIMICFEHLSNILNKYNLLYEHNSRRVILNIPKYLKLMKLQMNIRGLSGNYTPDICIQWWKSPSEPDDSLLNKELIKDYTFNEYEPFSISNWDKFLLPSSLLASSAGNAPAAAAQAAAAAPSLSIWTKAPAAQAAAPSLSIWTKAPAAAQAVAPSLSIWTTAPAAQAVAQADDTDSRKRRAPSQNPEEQKYLKYKAKYLQLKKLMNNMKL